MCTEVFEGLSNILQWNQPLAVCACPYAVCTTIFRELQTFLPIKHPVLVFESRLLLGCPLLSESYLPRVNWKVSCLSHTPSLESGDIFLLWTIRTSTPFWLLADCEWVYSEWQWFLCSMHMYVRSMRCCLCVLNDLNIFTVFSIQPEHVAFKSVCTWHSIFFVFCEVISLSWLIRQPQIKYIYRKLFIWHLLLMDTKQVSWTLYRVQQRPPTFSSALVPEVYFPFISFLKKSLLKLYKPWPKSYEVNHSKSKFDWTKLFENRTKIQR